jgi:purine nucleosidase
MNAVRRRVWLDADPGLDDWLTLLMLAADPGIEWLGTSVVAGNAPLSVTLANTLRIFAFHDLPGPVFAGAAQALAGPSGTAQDVLGSQGMRTTGSALPETTRQAQPQHAVVALAEQLRASASPITLLATGPLTHVAKLVQQHPELLGRIEECLWMGGSTDRGNQTPAAEFNAWADPEATDVVFNAGIPIRMFGLNLCRQVLLTQQHVQQVRQWPGEQAAVLAGYLDAYQRIRSADGSVPMPLYDPVVSAWLACPQAFAFEPARIDVELQGRWSRGMTVCDFKRRDGRPANAQVAVQAQGERVLQCVLGRLHRVLVGPSS